MRTPIIDFHVHLAEHEWMSESLVELYDEIFPDKQKREAFFTHYANPDNFVRLLRESGVDYAAVLCEVSPLTTGSVSNDLVEQFCARHEELIPFASVNPSLEGNMRRELKDLVLRRGFKGLKMYPTYQHFYPNEAKMYPVYETALELDIPVLFHTGSSVFKNARLKYGNPILYDDVATDFPDLTILLAHSGRGAWYDEAMTVARLHKNLYLEVSGLPVRKLLQYFPEMERFAHKFVFGTDWPQLEYPRTLANYRGLGLQEEALGLILGGNAAKILKMA